MQNYIGTTEAAKIIGVHPRTIRSWCIRGLLPHGNVGNSIAIDRKDLDNFSRPLRGNPNFRKKKPRKNMVKPNKL